MSFRPRRLVMVGVVWGGVVAFAWISGLDAIFVKGDHRLWWRVALWTVLLFGGVLLLPRVVAAGPVRATLFGAGLGYLSGFAAQVAWLLAMSSPWQRLKGSLDHALWVMFVPWFFPVIAGTPVWGVIMVLCARLILRKQDLKGFRTAPTEDCHK